MEIDPFCKIIAHELPAEILYEDVDTMAFFDAAPVAPGHVLVIPKKHSINITDTDEETLAAVMATVKKISVAVMAATGASGVQINSNHGKEAGQVVFHLHFHIIPRHDRSEFVFWAPGTYDTEKSPVLAEKIRNLLS